MPSVSSRRAVYTALAADLILAFAKLAAWLLTGSAAMLSETVHSFADTANQALLVVGMRRAQREADAEHPYGYGRERFVWALISAVGIVFVGCGVTLTHGLRRLFEPHPIERPELAVAILLLSLVLEGISLTIGLRTVAARARAHGISVKEALRSDADTLATAVVMEDGAAVFGALLALGALGATWVTGDPRFDALGSIAIGLLLGASATFLAHRNRSYLLGVSAPAPMRARLLAVLEAAAIVEEVKDVKVTMLGPDTLRFKAEVEFDGGELARAYLEDVSAEELRAMRSSDEATQRFLVQFAERLVDALGDAVDDLEDELRAEVPEARHVDLEADQRVRERSPPPTPVETPCPHTPSTTSSSSASPTLPGPRWPRASPAPSSATGCRSGRPAPPRRGSTLSPSGPWRSWASICRPIAPPPCRTSTRPRWTW